ncbi:NTF2-domain-containing protein [Ascodesmis nigricans]|uniref:NTF2-domain-containing protein n=1 Tax=Ascodesmis nigricans TaxID=341454 RepID=A0A4S2N0F1_9PEZI|nr:NTF2-domain-containing protein [Ascodesmis nigricans]
MASTTTSNASYLQNAEPQNFPANPTAAPSTYQATPQAQQTQQQASPGDLPKDEVGWYFVEQYYTTLNKTPDRLHLFYNKKSSFVWGTEGESLPLAHGRAEIQQKIAAHEFKDCKVRVSNVDSQGSAGNGIVIQVLGEMSNNGLQNRKFAQTFFLAEQPNGYYVLNDMFRYLKDDDDVEEGEYEYQAPAEEAAEAVQEVVEEVAEAVQELTVKETVKVEVDVGEGETVKVEETRTVEPEEVAEAIVEEAVIAVNEEEAAVVPEPEPEPEAAAPAPEAVAPQVEEAQPEPAVPEPVAAVEKAPTPPPAPKEPERAPAPAPAPAPARPKTWASLVASKPSVPAAAAPAPAAPAPQQPAPTVSAQPAPAPQAAVTAPSPATPTTPTTQSGGSQWQPVEKKGRNVPQQAHAAQTQAYIKNVSEVVSHQALKDALIKFGNIKHFEVNKQKNCAFVDFETPAGFAAARAANPITIEGVSIVIEERRRGPVNGSFGRGPQRGGYGPRDGQGRGGPPRGGTRGGYAPRGGFRTNAPGA